MYLIPDDPQGVVSIKRPSLSGGSILVSHYDLILAIPSIPDHALALSISSLD